MNRMHHAMFIAALGLTAAVSAPAAESAGAPMMHTSGAHAGHPMSLGAGHAHMSAAAGPALRSASHAVAARSASAGRSAAALRDTLPQTRMLFPIADPKLQAEWGDRYGICVGGPYDLGKDCARSVKAVTTDGLFDTTG